MCGNSPAFARDSRSRNLRGRRGSEARCCALSGGGRGTGWPRAHNFTELVIPAQANFRLAGMMTFQRPVGNFLKRETTEIFFIAGFRLDCRSIFI